MHCFRVFEEMLKACYFTTLGLTSRESRKLIFNKQKRFAAAVVAAAKLFHTSCLILLTGPILEIGH